MRFEIMALKKIQLLRSLPNLPSFCWRSDYDYSKGLLQERINLTRC